MNKAHSITQAMKNTTKRIKQTTDLIVISIGLSHFAISVESRETVDAMEHHLRELGVPVLGEGKVEMGYRRGYYCFLFEDPDRMMIEIVHHDPFYFSKKSPE